MRSINRSSTKYEIKTPDRRAEREGFEPPVPFSTSVFKTDAIDHSAIFPQKRLQRYYKKST